MDCAPSPPQSASRSPAAPAAAPPVAAPPAATAAPPSTQTAVSGETAALLAQADKMPKLCHEIKPLCLCVCVLPRSSRPDHRSRGSPAEDGHLQVGRGGSQKQGRRSQGPNAPAHRQGDAHEPWICVKCPNFLRLAIQMPFVAAAIRMKCM